MLVILWSWSYRWGKNLRSTDVSKTDYWYHNQNSNTVLFLFPKSFMSSFRKIITMLYFQWEKQFSVTKQAPKNELWESSPYRIWGWPPSLERPSWAPNALQPISFSNGHECLQAFYSISNFCVYLLCPFRGRQAACSELLYHSLLHPTVRKKARLKDNCKTLPIGSPWLSSNHL